jgi:hypothetical protein
MRLKLIHHTKCYRATLMIAFTAHELICKEHLDACRDASLLRTVQAIEQWMIGAEQRGATVTE